MRVRDTTSATLKPIMERMIGFRGTRLITDGTPAYRQMLQHMPRDIVDHKVEWVRGYVHTQNIDNFWSIIQRGAYGVLHHVGDGYLPQYLSEFEYRFNRRKISDVVRFAALMSQTQWRLLWYCQTL